MLSRTCGVVAEDTLAHNSTMSERKSTEQQRFDGALKSILQVSKADMQKMLADERKGHEGQPKRGPKPKTSVSGHAVSGKG